MKIGTTELVIGGILLFLLWPKKTGGNKPATPRSMPANRPADAASQQRDQVSGCRPYHAVV